jgi:hypothetical protein
MEKAIEKPISVSGGPDYLLSGRAPRAGGYRQKKTLYLPSQNRMRAVFR